MANHEAWTYVCNTNSLSPFVHFTLPSPLIQRVLFTTYCTNKTTLLYSICNIVPNIAIKCEESIRWLHSSLHNVIVKFRAWKPRLQIRAQWRVMFYQVPGTFNGEKEQAKKRDMYLWFLNGINIWKRDIRFDEDCKKCSTTCCHGRIRPDEIHTHICTPSPRNGSSHASRVTWNRFAPHFSGGSVRRWLESETLCCFLDFCSGSRPVPRSLQLKYGSLSWDLRVSVPLQDLLKINEMIRNRSPVTNRQQPTSKRQY